MSESWYGCDPLERGLHAACAGSIGGGVVHGAFEAGLSAPSPPASLELAFSAGIPRVLLRGTPAAPYGVEWSADLISWRPLAAGVTGSGGLLEIPDAAISPLRFYRPAE